MEGEVLTEVPINLQNLVQMVVRGFYTVEDMLIVDMLLRNLCLSEDNICDLLKFDRKLLRQRINILRTDKLLTMKIKMITLEDGKSQREQYYFINYKSFVNVVKYKLDHIRKKLEMEERDQTSRASFGCNNCQRTYTDLEADQLLDMATGQLVCIICRTEVQEDNTASLRGDSRLMLTRFNEQLEPLFTVLKEVENIKLSAEFSDPTPQEFNNGKVGPARGAKNGYDNNRAWSGDATKRSGFAVEGSIDVTINDTDHVEETLKAKEAPAWLSQTTAFITAKITPDDDTQQEVEIESTTGVTLPPTVAPAPETVSSKTTSSSKTKTSAEPPHRDDVMTLLQAHEPKAKAKPSDNNSDSDDSPDEAPKTKAAAVVAASNYSNEPSKDDILDSDDESKDGETVPVIMVGGERIHVDVVDSTVISRMTQEEKNIYINVYQEYYAGMDD